MVGCGWYTSYDLIQPIRALQHILVWELLGLLKAALLGCWEMEIVHWLAVLERWRITGSGIPVEARQERDQIWQSILMEFRKIIVETIRGFAVCGQDTGHLRTDDSILR